MGEAWKKEKAQISCIYKEEAAQNKAHLGAGKCAVGILELD